MRVAVVGLGWWGCELAAAAARTTSGGVISHGCSPVEAERAGFSERFGVPVVPTFDAILADPSIEAVILATPHSLHAGQVIAAATAGKHVFVEKPLALSVADAKAAVAACAHHRVMLAVGHNRRLLPQVETLRNLTTADCGALLHVEANFSTPEALALPAGHWRTSRQECPGGAMTVLGVHVIDWMHALFGPVQRVMANFGRRAVSTEMDDSATATLVFRSGLTATLVTLYASPYCNTFMIHGRDATISVVAAAPETENSRPIVTMQRRDGSISTFPMPYVDTLARQLERWAAACAGAAAPAVGGIEAACNIAVLEAITRSATMAGAPTLVDYASLL